MRLLHTMLRVGNLQASIDFYTNLMGMTLLRQSENKEYRYTLAFIGYGEESDTTVLELTYNWDKEQYNMGDAFGHIAIAVDDIYAICESIEQQGIIQPLVVRPHGDKYEIIAGERRFRAAQMADMENVPCIVRVLDDQTALAMALIENIQRSDLNAMEQAHALKRLMDTFSLSQEECAKQLGKSRSGVANFLRLLQLDPQVQMLLRTHQISMGQLDHYYL